MGHSLSPVGISGPSRHHLGTIWAPSQQDLNRVRLSAGADRTQDVAGCCGDKATHVYCPVGCGYERIHTLRLWRMQILTIKGSV